MDPYSRENSKRYSYKLLPNYLHLPTFKQKYQIITYQVIFIYLFIYFCYLFILLFFFFFFFFLGGGQS